MMLLIEARASTILYNFLVTNPRQGKYLLPVNICPIVPLTFRKAGVEFDLVDISFPSLRMDAGILLGCLDQPAQPYAGILYSHPYGEQDSPEDLFESIKRINPHTIIIDDKCLCVPDPDEATGKHADLVLYSTGYGKIVDFSSGGFGWIKPRFQYARSRLPFSPTALASLEKAYKKIIEKGEAFLYTDSDWLETEVFWQTQDYLAEIKRAVSSTLGHRKLINQIYSSGIPQELWLPERFQTWRFNILVPQSQELIDALFQNHLFASAHYPSLGASFGKGKPFPCAEELANSVVNLFNDYHYTPDMAVKTCDIIGTHLEFVRKPNENN